MFLCDIDKRPNSDYFGCESNIKLFHVMKSWTGESVCSCRKMARKFNVNEHITGILILPIQ